MNRSVVVTGIGTIGPHGAGIDELSRALERGRIETREVDRSAGYHDGGGSRRAGLVDQEVLASLIEPPLARRMSPPSRMAVAAARMAIASAGLESEEVRGEGTAVSLGTAFGCTTFTARLLQQIAELGPVAISPFLFMETVANAHAGQVALALEARGPNYTITQREASALLAVLRGCELIGNARAAVALAGAVDEMGPLLHAVLDRFGALVRAETEGGPERPRPFDARRTGFFASEGSTVLVLEEERAARARGVHVLARVLAGARANDPTASASDWGSDGNALGSQLRARLIAADVDPRTIECVVSGASGSRRGDRAEAMALRACFGTTLPSILVPKATTGEYGGGFLAAALLGSAGRPMPSSAGFVMDPELGIVPHAGGCVARRTLVSSLAAGGAAAWLVLEHVDP